MQKNNLLTITATALITAIVILGGLYFTQPNMFLGETRYNQNDLAKNQNTANHKTTNTKALSDNGLIGTISKVAEKISSGCTDISAMMNALDLLKGELMSSEIILDEVEAAETAKEAAEAKKAAAEGERQNLQNIIVQQAGGSWGTPDCPAGTAASVGNIGYWQTDTGNRVCLSAGQVSSFLAAAANWADQLSGYNDQIDQAEEDIADANDTLDSNPSAAELKTSIANLNKEIANLTTRIGLAISGGANICPPYENLEISDL